MTTQKPSKLELYVEVLRALEQPAKFGDIQKKISVDRASLVLAIDFLEKQDLIKKNNVNRNDSAYESTPRGQLVTKFFRERSQAAHNANIVYNMAEP